MESPNRKVETDIMTLSGENQRFDYTTWYRLSFHLWLDGWDMLIGPKVGIFGSERLW